MSDKVSDLVFDMGSPLSACNKKYETSNSDVIGFIQVTPQPQNWLPVTSWKNTFFNIPYITPITQKNISNRCCHCTTTST